MRELWTLWTCGQVIFNRIQLTHENDSHLDIFNLKEYTNNIIHIIHIQHFQGSHVNLYSPQFSPYQSTIDEILSTIQLFFIFTINCKKVINSVSNSDTL